MKFDLSKEIDRISAQNRLNKMKSDGNLIELKKIMPGRSLEQNAYLHKLFSLFAINFGLTLEEAKTDLKRACSFMHYTKEGKNYLRHTSKMQTDELTKFIDWVRTYSAQNGLYLQTPEEYRMEQARLDNLIESHREYL